MKREKLEKEFKRKFEQLEEKLEKEAMERGEDFSGTKALLDAELERQLDRNHPSSKKKHNKI